MDKIDPYTIRNLAMKVATSYFEDARKTELAILAEALCDDLTAAIPLGEDGDVEDAWTPTLEAVSALLKAALTDSAAEAVVRHAYAEQDDSARSHIESVTRVTAELLGYDLVPTAAGVA